MKIAALSTFGGESPRTDAQDLPEGAATLARDVVLWRGNVEPLRAPVLTAALMKNGIKRTIYRFGKDLASDALHWLHWAQDVDVARASVPDDAQERTYYTGEGEPRVTDSTLATQTVAMPSGYYRLGLPAPTKPTTSVSGSPTGTSPAQAMLAAYAFVSAWGEEGPLSPASDPVDWRSGQTLTVSGLDAAPSGAYNVALRRVYVSITDTNGATAFRFWRDVPLGPTSTAAVLDPLLLADEAPNPSPIAPPADGFGIMAHPRGFAVMFSGKQVCRSELFKPYAWPAVYRDPVAFDIVGGAILGDATVICTRAATYLATATDPLNFTPVQLEGAYPCVAKRTIRATSRGVVFASTGGLAIVTPNGAQASLTRGLFTRSQWQSLKPESMHAAVHDDRYYLWYDTGAERGGLIFEVQAGGVLMSRTSVYAHAAYADPRQDRLFISTDDGQLHAWDAGAALEAAWCGKEILLPRPFVVGAATVEADGYPVTFKVFCDGALHRTVSVANGRPFRFAGRRARRIRVQLETAGPSVRSFALATSIDSLVT